MGTEDPVKGPHNAPCASRKGPRSDERASRLPLYSDYIIEPNMQPNMKAVAAIAATIRSGMRAKPWRFTSGSRGSSQPRGRHRRLRGR
jgi:hypothetical protein